MTYRKTLGRIALPLMGAALLSACASPSHFAKLDVDNLQDARVNPTTTAQDELKRLPPPSQRIAVAVYDFNDQTGQFKSNATSQTLSRAVTQGASSILVKALRDAGDRSWFDVVERENLKNLLNERNIIREMRQRYLGETTVNPDALPPLMFAGILLEGGIISYDTNLKTGGLGARYLGIGGSTQYREDSVTVYLRAVSTKTGAILSSVTTEQRVASVGLAANAFRFVAFQELLEVDTGYTVNQPTQLAVQQAIEKAVYALVVDGIDSELWGFANPAQGEASIQDYRLRNDPRYAETLLASRPELDRPDSAKIVPEPTEGLNDEIISNVASDLLRTEPSAQASLTHQLRGAPN